MGWIRALIRRDRLERILDDELRHHIELQTEEYVRAGLSHADAERQARKHFGAVSLVKERCRDENGITLVETLWQDLRHGARNFASQPGLTAVLLITLALGIGANTAIFSTVDSALLRALPYEDPDRLVMVWEDASFAGFSKVTPAPGNFFEWKRRNHVFADMAATRSRSANLTGDGAPEQVAGLGVTSSFFSVLGVRPILGRTFSEEEDRANAPVAVISYGLWQGRYLGDPNVLGKPIVLDGNKITLIGVMGREFAFRDRDVAYWAPMGLSPADLQNRGSHFLSVVARLKPGVTLVGAREEMRVIASELARQYAEDARSSVLVTSMPEELIGDTRTGLLVLMAAAGGVLLIACSNLASLSLARTAARRREISVRVALGAGQGRLARQIFTEGIALAVVGGALGIGVALAGIRMLAGLVPAALPVTSQPALDARVLGFTLVLSIVTGLLFSLLPAFQAARTPVNEALTQTGRIGMTTRGRWMRDVLVAIEVGSALVLLVGAGLLLQTLVRLQAIDVGFRSDHLLVARTVLPFAKYPTPAARLAFSERVLEGIRTLPGVEGAAYASTLPFLSQGNVRGYQVEGHPVNLNEPAALYRLATSDYLQTLGVRLVEGRFFDRRDGRDTPPVVVINETFARLYWPNESALGASHHRRNAKTRLADHCGSGA
jgi:putative ABC transport system permease protein